MSERALVYIRSSQGDDAKEALEEQRDVLPELACDVVDATPENVDEFGSGAQVEELDLGVQTGFSTFERDPDEYDLTLLDNHPDVQEAIERLENGEYDVLVAKDIERVSRDDYFAHFKRALRRGDADFVFWQDDSGDVDSLASGVTRFVARKKKQQEIEDSKRALRNKMERGEPVGRPAYGYKYNTNRTALVPDLLEFNRALRVLELLNADDWTWAEIEEETGVSQGTMAGIRDRREEYLADAREHEDVELPEELEQPAVS